MVRGRALFFILVVLIAFVPQAFADEPTLFTLWPLIDYRTDPSIAYRSLHLLGPFIKYETKGDETEFALRPFIYRASDDSGATQTELLYPLGQKHKEQDSSSFDLLHLLNSDFGKRESGTSNQFYLFPFLFYGEDPEQGKYAAFFPFGGKLYGWFGRDRISFVLFPLYSQTQRGTTITNNVIWPFFSWLHGDKESGFAIWPLYGQSSKEGVYHKKFCLWPIYFNEEKKLDTGNPESRFAVFPLWYEKESRNYSQRTLLWPFFTWIQDRSGEYEQWDAPWPLVRVTHGSTRNGLRLLPFYADEKVEARRTRWFLWPIYKIEDLETDLILRQRHRVLFFLYSDLAERKLDTGEETRRIDMWPLFSYQRHKGVSRFDMLAIIEPFFPSNQAIERSWSPLWRIYQQRWDQQGNLVISILWNLYWQESRGKQLAFELFPLVSYHRDEEKSRLRILKGLISLQNEEQRRCMSFFYLPWEACWPIEKIAPQDTLANDN